MLPGTLSFGAYTMAVFFPYTGFSTGLIFSNLKRIKIRLSSKLLANILPIALMFAFTLYGWLLFRADSFDQIWNMTSAIWTFSFDQYFLYNMAKLFYYALAVICLANTPVFFRRFSYFPAVESSTSNHYLLRYGFPVYCVR